MLENEDVLYNNFEDFVSSVIFPTGNMSQQLGGFIFRGESSNKYKLLPSALRPETKSGYMQEPNLMGINLNGSFGKFRLSICFYEDFTKLLTVMG
jgi:hypothetical protein